MSRERYGDDPTVEFGDHYIRDGVWADLDASAITRTWLAVVDGEVGGYIALAADAVRLTRGEKKAAELEGVQFSRYGCIQIVMLAVRAELHGQDIGTALVDHAVLVARDAGKDIGARFLAADVNPSSQGFYERYGFARAAMGAAPPNPPAARVTQACLMEL